VNYSDERPVLEYALFEYSTTDEAVRIAKTILYKGYTVKAKSWSYEKEYRQFRLLESCVPSRGVYFIDAHPLERVVIGVRCDTDKSYFNHLLRCYGYKDVKVVKARQNLISYKIEA
jgi:hypothetical protein